VIDIDIGRNVLSLTEFKARTSEYLAELQDGNRALVITVNGNAAMAVVSAATLQYILEALDTLDTLHCIRAGIEDMNTGRTVPLDEAFAKARTSLGLTKSKA
jgi:prevent-host-death family protein